VNEMQVIFSAERPARTPAQDLENAKRSTALQLWLSEMGYEYTPARGCYKGVEERSVVVLVDNDSDFDELLFHAFDMLGQESVLLLDPTDGSAALRYDDGRVEPIGYFHQVPEHVARARDGWTRVIKGAMQHSETAWYVVSDRVPPSHLTTVDA
jgi:hypothetical protein